ncbi:MAG: sulfite exporter TauE/SafE family protein [Myxococcota bacterium]
MEPADFLTLAVLFAVVIAAQIVETVAGFGATVIALAVGVQLVPIELLVVTLVLIGVVQSSWIVARGRMHVRMRLLFTRILPLCVLGLGVGNLLFHHVDAQLLKVVLGAFVVAFSGWRLWQLFTGRDIKALSPAVGAGLLTAGGFFHGLFAAGGPLVVYYASRTIDERHAFRATLSSLWLILNIVLLTSYWAHGQLARPPVSLAITLLPAVVVGVVVGEILHSRVNEILFRKVVQVLLFATGVCLLL